jgi:hypothetical protein
MLAVIAGGVLEGSPSTAVTSSLPLRSVWLHATPATIPRTAPKNGIRVTAAAFRVFTMGMPRVHHADRSQWAGPGTLAVIARDPGRAGARARLDRPQRGDAGMATAPGTPAATRPGRAIHLSDLLKRPITDSKGESLGRVEDVVVPLPGDPLPVVKGLVAKVGGREVFIPVEKTGGRAAAARAGLP